MYGRYFHGHSRLCVRIHGLMTLDSSRRFLPAEQWRRNRLAINIAAALVFSGFTFVVPFLPLYVRELGVQGEANIATWAGCS